MFLTALAKNKESRQIAVIILFLGMDFFIFTENNILVTKQSHSPLQASDISRKEVSQLCQLLSTENLSPQSFLYDEKSSLAVTFIQSTKNLSSSSPIKTTCSHTQELTSYKFIPVRQYFAEKSATEGAKASRAKGLATWWLNTNFCVKCGTKLIGKNTKSISLKVCPSCKIEVFPRIEPCVIVLIFKGTEILLARHTYRNQNVFTCLAGFMEIGESAEQTVEREIREEANIKVKNIRYVKSQGWPFPDQLMLAFIAEYDSGELKAQPDEIAELDWFSVSNLPAIPSPGSVANYLITNFDKLKA